jgi:Ca2+-binding EF-hand superfamily protein
VDKASTDLFAVFDKDGDGMLNREELIAALKMVGHGDVVSSGAESKQGEAVS